MNPNDSKLAKSLQNHDLDNLVYEKRQRKTVQPSPLNQLPSKNNSPQKKKNISKKQEKNTKEKSKQIQKAKQSKHQVKTKKIVKKRKYLTSKDLSSNKKAKQTINAQPVLPKQNKQSRITRSRQVSSVQKLREKSSSKDINQMKIAPKSNILKSILQKSAKSPKKYVQPQIKKTQQKNQQSSVKQVELVQKTPKKIGRPRKVIESVSNIAQNDPQNDAQNQDKANVQVSPTKNRVLMNLLYSDSKKSMNQQVQPPKPRQAKLNALKKYTQKQLFQQDSYEYGRGGFTNKKKRIVKDRQGQQAYSINRIFRKQPKLDLNPVNINVKLDKLSLNAFCQKFGTFDVIHCSLPLTMIWELSEIENLMTKGFLFFWVEKGQIPLAYHLMNKLGYDVIDQIVWVKSDQATRTVFNQPITQEETYLTQQNLFLNSKSVCFVGYKCPTGQKAEYRTKISNNLVFAKPSRSHPIKKPQQIYEIADLLMPGSKKLQLGGYEQKGWLSLHHFQTRLRKCSRCFVQLCEKKCFLLKNSSNSISSICEKCYNVHQAQNLKNEQIENESNSGQSSSLVNYTNDNLIVIGNIDYVSPDTQQKCSKCNNCGHEQLILCVCHNKDEPKSLICKQCYEKQFERHKSHVVESLRLKRKFFTNRIQQNCSQCDKTTFVSHYYECLSSGCRNKSHILCAECFWKTGYETMRQEKTPVSEVKKNKNDGMHEWKIRKIRMMPFQKIACSCQCKTQLHLPYYVCETCVGWRWCGKCKILNQSDAQHHSMNSLCLDKENESQIHKLALIS